MPTRRYSSLRHRPPRRREQSLPTRKRRFSDWLAIVVAGGFLGTLGALNLAPEFGASAAPAERLTPTDGLTADFGLCHSGGGRDCVVDGDTFWFAGEKYRIADIDTPETHPSRCDREARLGAAATGRLRDWLNAGAFSLEPADRDTDRYGRKLRIVTRGGASVGTALEAEGLARRWEGRRRSWC